MARSGPGWCPFATQVEGVTQFTIGGETKVGFCDHTAGGFFTTLADGGFWNRQGYSVHFGISRKGEVCQIVNIFDTAWAQGLDSRGQPVGPTSPGITWLPFDQMGKRSPNNYLISTEHEDYELVNGVSHSIPGSQWTDAEFDADRRVKAWCIAETQRVKGADLMKFGIDSLASHHMFDPVNRAYCAGAYWRNEYRQRLFAALTFATPVQEDSMANLNADGSQRIVSEGNFIVTYNGNIPVTRLGSTDGKYPGRLSKNFGGTWLWLRTLDEKGNLVAPYFSAVEGD